MTADGKSHDDGHSGLIAFEKKSRKQARRMGDDDSLNINSMMDIMTILLVFLLVSITSDPLNVKQDDYLKLAKSTADYNPQDSIPVIVNKQAIIVDNKEVVRVECVRNGGRCQLEDYQESDNSYSVDKAFKEDGDESKFLIEPLHKRLETIVKVQKAEAKDLGREYSPTATFVIDREIPYRLVSEIVYTSGMAGLSNLRFAVIKTNSR